MFLERVVPSEPLCAQLTWSTDGALHMEGTEVAWEGAPACTDDICHEIGKAACMA